MNTLKIDTNSWHYKLLLNYHKDNEFMMPRTLCSYFWSFPKMLMHFLLFTAIGTVLGGFVALCLVSPIVTLLTNVFADHMFPMQPFHLYVINGCQYPYDSMLQNPNMWVTMIGYLPCIMFWFLGSLVIYDVYLKHNYKVQSNIDRIYSTVSEVKSMSFTQVIIQTIVATKKKYCPIIEYVDTRTSNDQQA